AGGVLAKELPPVIEVEGRAMVRRRRRDHRAAAVEDRPAAGARVVARSAAMARGAVVAGHAGVGVVRSVAVAPFAAAGERRRGDEDSDREPTTHVHGSAYSNAWAGRILRRFPQRSAVERALGERGSLGVSAPDAELRP